EARPSRKRRLVEAPRYVSAGECWLRRRRLRLALTPCVPMVAPPVAERDCRPPPLTSCSLRNDMLVTRVGEYRTVSATGDRSTSLRPCTLLAYVGSYWLASVSE